MRNERDGEKERGERFREERAIELEREKIQGERRARGREESARESEGEGRAIERGESRRGRREREREESARERGGKQVKFLELSEAQEFFCIDLS